MDRKHLRLTNRGTKEAEHKPMNTSMLYKGNGAYTYMNIDV